MEDLLEEWLSAPAAYPAARLAIEALAEVGALAQGAEADRRASARDGERLIESARRSEELARAQEDAVRRLSSSSERVRRAAGG